MTLILAIGAVWILGSILFLSLARAAAMGDRQQAEQLEAEQRAVAEELPAPPVERPRVTARAA